MISDLAGLARRQAMKFCTAAPGEKQGTPHWRAMANGRCRMHGGSERAMKHGNQPRRRRHQRRMFARWIDRVADSLIKLGERFKADL